tara:strand:- start:13187 stop:13339 length:153 start_codon:yes stop_codon:yes gene_type:complete
MTEKQERTSYGEVSSSMVKCPCCEEETWVAYDTEGIGYCGECGEELEVDY